MSRNRILITGFCWTFMSSAYFALRFCLLSALAFKRSASKNRTPFSTAYFQPVLFSASSCQVSV